MTPEPTLRERAEQLLSTKPAEIPSLPTEDVQALVHDLQLHQAKLEIQNEELRHAQLELAKTRDHYADFYDFAPVGYIMLDPEGVILEANFTAATLLDVERSTLPGTKLSSYLDPDSQDALSLHRQAVFTEDSKQTCEIEMRPSGELIRLSLRLESIAFGTGDDRRCRTTLIDINKRKGAERKQAEAALRKIEETNRAILKATVDAIVTIDREGVIVSANPATERMFGYSSQQLLGQNVKILMPSPFREEHDDYLARYHETGEAKIIGGSGREVEGQRVDGSTFPVELAVSKVEGLGLYTGIIRDITERKRVVEDLRRQAEFTESLIETAQCIVLVLDPEGKIVRYNGVLEELTGLSLEETRGKDWFETFLPERDRERIGGLFKKAVGGARTRGNINAIVTRNGEEREIEWFDTTLTDSGGNLAGLLCTGVDVTERQRLQQEVYQAAEEEKQRIALELHDGLGALLSAGRMIATALAGKVRAGEPVNLENIEAVSEHFREAITQTRALSRGLQPINGEPGALHEGFKSFAEQIDSASEARCRFVALHGVVEVANSIAANHLYRIGQEAVHNAIRHAEPAKVTISLDKRSADVVLTVEDDGKGFDTDQQLLNLGDRGIGLHTMQYRAHALGGSLTIDSTPGEGTKVVCRAPLAG